MATDEWGIPEFKKSDWSKLAYEMFMANRQKAQSALQPATTPGPITSMLPAGTAPSGMTVGPQPPAGSAPPPTSPAAAPSWTENLNKGLQDPAKLGLLATGLSMIATPPREGPYSPPRNVRR